MPACWNTPPQTEQILAGRLAELGGSVDRGVTVLSLAERDDSVLAELEEADGTRRSASVAWVIGAGGAHSLTRRSMAESLAGSTYPGTALVGDVQVSCALLRDGSALIASPAGYVLLAPLPDDRWLTFVGDLGEAEATALTSDHSPGQVAAAIGRRIPVSRLQLTGVAWAATFHMHRRMVPRLADAWRFLLGDAGHLSSPFGGEGLNSGLHDASNLAWKLALQVRGRARPGLLGTFAAERRDADRHVLQVSDRVHQLAHAAVESARTGSFPAPPAPQVADRIDQSGHDGQGEQRGYCPAAAERGSGSHQPATRSAALTLAMIAPPSAMETNERRKLVLKKRQRIQASVTNSKAIAASARMCR